MTIVLDINPKVIPTAQHKGCNHKTGTVYTKATVRRARKMLTMMLLASGVRSAEHDGGWIMSVYFFYRPAQFPRRLWGRPKTTKPDTENVLKLLKDAIEDSGIAFADDAQVFDEHTVKRYVANPDTQPSVIIELEREP